MGQTADKTRHLRRCSHAAGLFPAAAAAAANISGDNKAEEPDGRKEQANVAVLLQCCGIDSPADEGAGTQRSQASLDGSRASNCYIQVRSEHTPQVWPRVESDFNGLLF